MGHLFFTPWKPVDGSETKSGKSVDDFVNFGSFCLFRRRGMRFSSLFRRPFESTHFFSVFRTPLREHSLLFRSDLAFSVSSEMYSVIDILVGL